MNLVTSTASALLTLSLLAFGCGGSRPAPASPPAESHAHTGSGEMGHSCPMMTSDAQVAATDTPDGVAMVFTTHDDVAKLREHVHGMPAMHEKMMSGGMHGSGMMMVPSTARVEDVDGGARIVLTPNDPAQLAQLREQGREHASHMATGHCPMMDGEK